MADSVASGAREASQPTVARLRVLLFSDLHLDRPYEWAPPTVAEARRAAGREVLVELLSAARQHAVDAIACAGDLFDRRTIRPGSMQWLKAALRSAGVPVLVAPGNRDFVDPLGGYTCQDWPDNVTVFTIDRFTPVEVVQGVTIWGAAHTEAHRGHSFFDQFHVDRGGVSLALFHGTERAGNEREPDLDPSAQFDEAAIELAGFDHALVGHYRQPYFGRLLTYPGSPLAHDFGASASGGAVLVTVNNDGSISRDFLSIGSPELHDVSVDLTGTTSKLEAVLRVKALAADQSGVIRVRFTGRVSPEVILQREDLLGLVASPEDLILQWNVQVDTDEFAKEQTIRGQLVRDVLAAPLPSEDRRQRVLLIGLRALADSDALEGSR